MSPYEIRTFSGRFVRPGFVLRTDVCIEDIAHSLSLQCRFGGHTHHFWSVAQHSVMVSRRMPVGCPTAWRFAALHHDSSEAYLGDVVRPLKIEREMGWYRVTERATELTIFEAFGLGDHISLEMMEAIKSADNAQLEWEQAQGIELRGLDPVTAELLFLNEHAKYVDLFAPAEVA